MAKRPAPVPAGPLPVSLAGVGVALPPYPLDTSGLREVLARLWPQRASHLPTLLRELTGSRRWLVRPPGELHQRLSLSDQTAAYGRFATPLAAAACRTALAAAGVGAAAVDLLVVASCTGFCLPGPDAQLVDQLGLRPDVTRLPLTQLGCAGGAAGLARAAEWLRGAGRGRMALVAAVELPSLTLQPEDDSLDNLLSALVFGDAAGAAVLVGPGGPPPAGGAQAPVVLRTREWLAPGTADALGFGLDDRGFRVRLARDLPRQLAALMPEVVARFLAPGAVAELEVVAVHPGGPRVISAAAAALGAAPRAVAASRAAFRRASNPSSAAIFVVLDELAAGRHHPGPGAHGLLLGVGPGLTLELVELRWPGARVSA
ncbi:MAG TPA: type III polyketide synthase [Verrucomicrobiae bacterium]|nr:type III polyketide synthase [Verrucomicrobiae bacterium]